MSKISIPNFFQNQSVFITGGSGFIGKVLIEKLLRSCPDLKQIYLLMRTKKGKTPQERLSDITDIPLFDRLRSENSFALNKLNIINGDINELRLGICDEDWKLLVEEVNIIINSAASIRFDDPLTKAIFVNVRSVRELMFLASEIKTLRVLVHISTAYAHTDRSIVDEQLYPSHQNWKSAIKIAENVDQTLLDQLTVKYIAPLHNTYTFAKSLAEHVVYDMSNGKFPAIVLRPSIVAATMHQPVIGWIDNFNGPMSIIVATQKGIIRTLNIGPNTVADFIPVDVIARLVIMAAWFKGTTKDSSERLKTDFCNLTSNGYIYLTYKQLLQLCNEFAASLPFNDILWYPNACSDKYYVIHLVKFFFYQLIPAMWLDGIIKLCGYKPILTRLQRRIYTAAVSLDYFMKNSWTFINKKSTQLNDSLHPSDYDDFDCVSNIASPSEIVKYTIMGARKYLLKESDESFEQAKKHSNRMYWISWGFTIFWYLGLIWLVFFKVDFTSVLVNCLL